MPQSIKWNISSINYLGFGTTFLYRNSIVLSKQANFVIVYGICLPHNGPIDLKNPRKPSSAQILCMAGTKRFGNVPKGLKILKVKVKEVSQASGRNIKYLPVTLYHLSNLHDRKCDLTFETFPWINNLCSPQQKHAKSFILIQTIENTNSRTIQLKHN